MAEFGLWSEIEPTVTVWDPGRVIGAAGKRCAGNDFGVGVAKVIRKGGRG